MLIKPYFVLTLATVSLLLCFNRELPAGIVDETDYYQSDQIVGHIHKPYAKREYAWPEAKTGKIVGKTNNLGFRKDVDTKINQASGITRILVTGDSHIDGVVDNRESFPNLLEDKLNAKIPAAKFEVLNGGVGYYGPDHYLLFLHKFLVLKPDVYIVVIYTGNDFLDAARILEARDGMNQRPKKYFTSLRNCMWNDGAISQAMDQIYYFKTFPGMKEKVVKHTLEIILKISNLCKQHKIDFILVFLPTKADVEWQSDGDILGKMKDCLELNDLDLKVNRKLTERLIEGVSKNNIIFFDLYRLMKNQNEEFYWKKDYHLNDHGHSFLAEKIYEKYYGFFRRQHWN